MKKKLKGILLFLAIICLSVAFVSPVSAQVYIGEVVSQFLIKHNADGSVDFVQYKDIQSYDGNQEKDFLSDFFSDPDNLGFKKVSFSNSHILSLRNDGLFKFKPCMNGLIDRPSGQEITMPNVKDYSMTVNNSIYDEVIILLLITDNGEQIPFYISPVPTNTLYLEDQVKDFFAEPKELMQPSGQATASEVYTAEFDPQYSNGIGIKIKKNGKGIGSFKALSKQPGAKYIKDSLYIEDDKVVVKVIIGNGKYKGLQICGEWEKFPPFLNIVGPKKCN